MKGDYPRFKATYTHDELVEHFLLTPAEHAVVDTCHGEANRHGVAVLLKAVQYLGYFPSTLSAGASGRPDFSSRTSSNCCGTTRRTIRGTADTRYPSALIRQHTGFRFPTGQDKQALETWLRTAAGPTAPTEEDLCECAYARLPGTRALNCRPERELQRLVRAALHGFFQDLYTRVTAQLPPEVLARLDALLLVESDASQSAV